MADECWTFDSYDYVLLREVGERKQSLSKHPLTKAAKGDWTGRLWGEGAIAGHETLETTRFYCQPLATT